MAVASNRACSRLPAATYPAQCQPHPCPPPCPAHACLARNALPCALQAQAYNAFSSALVIPQSKVDLTAPVNEFAHKASAAAGWIGGLAPRELGRGAHVTSRVGQVRTT